VICVLPTGLCNGVLGTTDTSDLLRLVMFGFSGGGCTGDDDGTGGGFQNVFKVTGAVVVKSNGFLGRFAGFVGVSSNPGNFFRKSPILDSKRYLSNRFTSGG
jgi:hypothetical protein